MALIYLVRRSFVVLLTGRLYLAVFVIFIDMLLVCEALHNHSNC